MKRETKGIPAGEPRTESSEATAENEITDMSEEFDGNQQGDFTEVPGNKESVEDLESLSGELISNAVVSATDWTTETIVNQINKGNIMLNPRFQRRDAWESQRKSRFIESLFLGFPIPQLVLAESKDRKGAYIVIDGKQRLLSIRQFSAAPDDPEYNQLKLSGLTIRKDLLRRSLNDLRDDPNYFADISSFENQPIRTVVIKNWKKETFLYQVFLRLNTGSVPLSPQELRQALHPGPFVEFADVRSGDSDALREILNLKKPDFRMRDAELLIRYYAFQYFIGKYTGDLKSFLDTTCETLNKLWSERQNDIEELSTQFEEAYRASREIFGPGNVFRKWTGKNYEKPFNRAIFDVMMYFFTVPQIRESAIANKEAIEAAFRELCSTNSDFLSFIERTTKSTTATYGRLEIWGTTIEKILGLRAALRFHSSLFDAQI